MSQTVAVALIFALLAFPVGVAVGLCWSCPKPTELEDR